MGVHNRYLPSISLANDVLDEIITATELEVAKLEKQLNKYDRTGNVEAAKVTVEVLFSAYRKLSSYKEMQKGLPKRSREGRTFEFGKLKGELV